MLSWSYIFIAMLAVRQWVKADNSCILMADSNIATEVDNNIEDSVDGRCIESDNDELSLISASHAVVRHTKILRSVHDASNQPLDEKTSHLELEAELQPQSDQDGLLHLELEAEQAELQPQSDQDGLLHLELEAEQASANALAASAARELSSKAPTPRLLEADPEAEPRLVSPGTSTAIGEELRLEEEEAADENPQSAAPVKAKQAVEDNASPPAIMALSEKNTKTKSEVHQEAHGQHKVSEDSHAALTREAPEDAKHEAEPGLHKMERRAEKGGMNVNMHLNFEEANVTQKPAEMRLVNDHTVEAEATTDKASMEADELSKKVEEDLVSQSHLVSASHSSKDDEITGAFETNARQEDEEDDISPDEKEILALQSVESPPENQTYALPGTDERTKEAFPKVIDGYALVSKVEKKVEAAGYTMHPFDVGMYIKADAPFWGSQDLTPQKMIDEMEGFSFLRYVIMMKPYEGPLKAKLDKLLYKATVKTLHQSMMGDVPSRPGMVAEYANLTLSMSGSPLYSVHTLYLDKNDVRLDSNGKGRGWIANAPELSRSLVNMYEDPHSAQHIDGFLSSAVDKIEQGLPSEPGLEVPKGETGGSSSWYCGGGAFTNLVAALVVVFAIIGCGYSASILREYIIWKNAQSNEQPSGV
eukprot:gnl/TRDRNA2_/TRDRNA2_175472_c0_seq8.p1 gnl/TRDRNA2_/TRDRNA2_175472_c0~~gnl/TRDRNA2_/TRDRNA2_175472_c0_seq8.p1  ORF type:complete len:647 (-),score=152.49 gnl/TRDRNA2_/TRDRNA2_175472_c0_seq8:85-2025(-)